MTEQQLMIGYPDEDKNALWEAKYEMGRYVQIKER
jgi:hypothetical protein